QAMDGKGTLTVSTGREKGKALLTVEDTGCGIPAGKLGDIFKPFHTTKSQGTGLGLAVAERIVKGHGGPLSAASRPGRRARFAVSLPYAEGWDGEAPASHRRGRPARGDLARLGAQEEGLRGRLRQVRGRGRPEARGSGLRRRPHGPAPGRRGRPGRPR